MVSKPLKLTCIGGGTGLSALLSGIRKYSHTSRSDMQIVDMDELSAVVSVSDDGGSTGRLIDEFDVLPPGDVRKLLVSLSEADELVARLFEYRFSGNGDLGGHTVGNILLTALIESAPCLGLLYRKLGFWDATALAKPWPDTHEGSHGIQIILLSIVGSSVSQIAF